MPTLIPCPACKKKMSADADACPKCGHPPDDAQRQKAFKEQADAKKGAVILLVLLVVGFGAWNMFGDSGAPEKAATAKPAVTQASQSGQASTQASQTSTQAAPPAAPKPKAAFPMTVDAFIKTFNANANTPKKGTLKLTKLKDTEESGDAGSSVQAAIGKHSRLVISSDKTGNMTDVTMISGGEKINALDTAEMMLSWVTIVQTLSPGLTPEQRGQVLKDMGLMQEKMKDTGEIERGGVRYWYSMGKGMGIWFGAVGK